VARDLAAAANARTLLYLNKCPNLDVIANFAAVKVRKTEDLYPFAQFHVGRNALKTLMAHRSDRRNNARIGCRNNKAAMPIAVPVSVTVKPLAAPMSVVPGRQISKRDGFPF